MNGESMVNHPQMLSFVGLLPIPARETHSHGLVLVIALGPIYRTGLKRIGLVEYGKFNFLYAYVSDILCSIQIYSFCRSFLSEAHLLSQLGRTARTIRIPVKVVVLTMLLASLIYLFISNHARIYDWRRI